MSEFWTTCLVRAEYLSTQDSATSELLSFYAKLLQAQQEIDHELRKNQLPPENLPPELKFLKPFLPILLQTVKDHGPPLLASEARALIDASDETVEDLLLTYCDARSDTQFFAKAFLQPYKRWLSELGLLLPSRDSVQQENRCPFCGGPPQLSFLQTKEQSAESGNRDLLCANCLSTWPFRRVVCANCLEERPFKLAYFSTTEYAHVRVEACDTCRHYLKGIDLTVLGLAVPLVDEVASAALDVWAKEHGYKKIELNLVGL